MTLKNSDMVRELSHTMDADIVDDGPFFNELVSICRAIVDDGLSWDSDISRYTVSHAGLDKGNYDESIFK